VKADQLIQNIRTKLGADWLPELYSSRVRSQRTRSHRIDIAPREHLPEILYTLLGIELKVGKVRFQCPDLATARYMRIFARLGIAEFAVPYDISRISAIADDLETSWRRGLLILMQESEGSSDRSRSVLRRALIKEIRNEIEAVGPGEKMPKFDRETRQRKS